MTSGVTIRRARDADAEALAVLLTQLGYPTDSSAVPERMARMRAETGQHILVAELGWVNNLQAVILSTLVSAFGVVFMRQ